MGSADAIFAPDDVLEASIKKTNAKTVELEPHICRHCFGRIVSHEIFLSDKSLAREYTCTNCGATERGKAASVLCCCGIKLNPVNPGGQATDAGIRCHPNPNPKPDFPALFVASVGGGKR